MGSLLGCRLWGRTESDTTKVTQQQEELKSLLVKVKEESEKAGLKLNIQKSKIMASGPIISWQIEGEKVETVTDFLFLGSKITVDGDCSHEIKRCLLPRKYACRRFGISLGDVSNQIYCSLVNPLIYW